MPDNVRTFWTGRCFVCGRRVQASGPPAGWTCSRHAPGLTGAVTELERTRAALDVALDTLELEALRRVLELATRLVPTPAAFERKASRLIVQVSAGVWRCGVCGEPMHDPDAACKCKGWAKKDV